MVERAHHHILASRLDAYRPEQLERLHEEGRVFEHFTHDASLIPARWFPHWRHRFERTFTSEWWRKRKEDAGAVVSRVLARIRDEGPLMSKDFEQERPRGSASGWWEWGPTKAALELLWRTGALAVARRVNFQKVYDLTERVLPVESSLPKPDADATADWACESALDRLGVATPAELAAFWHAVKPPGARAWCEKAVREGRAVPALVVSADGSEPKHAFALPEWRERVERAPAPPGRVRLLSPFDPVLRDRKRAQRIFGFTYSFEAFVPRKKRKFGYYVLPILEGERLIGRLDPKLHRERGLLEVQSLWWEPKVRVTRKRRAALEEAVGRFSRYLGAREWTLPG
ncbi:YcaQ family DNA glycosylase [bacterium]|nr:YcaQ family DNA glycosylase [bacterium]